MNSPAIDFMIEMERIGEEIDLAAPQHPAGHGRETWIIERARQAVEHVEATRKHRVDRITVNGSAGDIPEQLEDAWPDDLPPVHVSTEEDRYSEPLPDGVFRMWLEISYDPDAQDPAVAKEGGWLADMAYLHGVAPDRTQEDDLHRVGGTGAVWPQARTAGLEAALTEAAARK